jgi:hypothetical protein
VERPWGSPRDPGSFEPSRELHRRRRKGNDPQSGITYAITKISGEADSSAASGRDRDVEPPFVIAADADAFAAATAGLLSDIESRRALAERAAAFVTEHHSAEAYGRRLEAVHQEAVTRRRSSDRRNLDRQAPATTTP